MPQFHVQPGEAVNVGDLFRVVYRGTDTGGRPLFKFVHGSRIGDYPVPIPAGCEIRFGVIAASDGSADVAIDAIPPQDIVHVAQPR